MSNVRPRDRSDRRQDDRSDRPAAVPDIKSEALAESMVAVLLFIMTEKSISLRMVAERTGLPKSRVGLLLHRDGTKRADMRLNDLELLLDSVGIDLEQALAWREFAATASATDPPLRDAAIELICSTFSELPSLLVTTLEQVDGVDGSELRLEWAPVLRRAIVQRLTQEVAAVIRRRGSIAKGPV